MTISYGEKKRPVVFWDDAKNFALDKAKELIK